MKIAALLATTGLACLVTADVQLFTDTQCMSNDFLYSTDAGNCYTLDTLAMDYFSALGCSVDHNLRVYAGADCGGAYTEVKKLCPSCVKTSMLIPVTQSLVHALIAAHAYRLYYPAELQRVGKRSKLLSPSSPRFCPFSPDLSFDDAPGRSGPKTSTLTRGPIESETRSSRHATAVVSIVPHMEGVKGRGPIHVWAIAARQLQGCIARLVFQARQRNLEKQ
nr:hypothetical protein CFP56_65496 [Quercus suber]